jgi:hypothetical protein
VKELKMNEAEKLKSIIQKKCPSCYKKDWCMLSPYQRAVECLGPFMDVEDNQKKHREYFEEEKKPKADLDRIEWDVLLNTYLRNKRLFNDWVIRGIDNSDDK